jgi:hypothetical protein
MRTAPPIVEQNVSAREACPSCTSYSAWYARSASSRRSSGSPSARVAASIPATTTAADDPESGAERDVALDGDVEAGVGRVSRVPGLPDRGVDVTHRGLDQRGRHVHVGPVAGTAGVLDGEPVEREVLGLDADVVV